MLQSIWKSFLLHFDIFNHWHIINLEIQLLLGSPLCIIILLEIWTIVHEILYALDRFFLFPKLCKQFVNHSLVLSMNVFFNQHFNIGIRIQVIIVDVQSLLATGNNWKSLSVPNVLLNIIFSNLAHQIATSLFLLQLIITQFKTEDFLILDVLLKGLNWIAFLKFSTC